MSKLIHIISSMDGNTWNLATANGAITLDLLAGVTVNSNGQFVAVGDHGTIISSVDGINWKITSPTTLRVTKVLFGIC